MADPLSRLPNVGFRHQSGPSMTPTQAAQWFNEFLTALTPEAWTAIRTAIQGQPSRVEVNGMEAAEALKCVAEGKPTGDPNVDAFFARKRGLAPPIQDPTVACDAASAAARQAREDREKREAAFWDEWDGSLNNGYYWAKDANGAWDLIKVSAAHGSVWGQPFGVEGDVDLLDFVDFVRVDIRPPSISVDAPPEP